MGSTGFMLDLKKSVYFRSLPEDIRQSIMESKMQDGTIFESEEELRRFTAQYLSSKNKAK